MGYYLKAGPMAPMKCVCVCLYHLGLSHPTQTTTNNKKKVCAQRAAKEYLLNERRPPAPKWDHEVTRLATEIIF